METFKFESSFGRKLGMAHTVLIRHLSALMKEKNLPITPDQFRVLAYLWENDGLQQTKIADCTDRNRANVTRIIDILEREGIVERKDDAQDRRVYRIFLTKYGKSLEKDTKACAQRSLEDALEGVSKEEKEITMNVLQKIQDNLR